VVVKFLEMTGAKDDERLKAIAAAEAAKDKTLKEIDEERQTITDRSRELDERKAKLQSELRDELAEIAKEDRPLVQDLARLEARAVAINRDLFAYDNEIGRLRALADREENENVRRQLLREAERLAFIASRIQTDLLSLNRQADAVNAQRAGLLSRQRQAQATTADQVRRIDEELTDLAKRDKRNDAIEKRAARPATGVTSKGRALAVQAKALSTYEQFPLEAEKAKLLASLK
jgi:chromosome segregation ATPase